MTIITKDKAQKLLTGWSDYAAALKKPTAEVSTIVDLLNSLIAAIAERDAALAQLAEAQARGMEQAAAIATEHWALLMASADRLGEFDDEKAQKLSESAGVRAQEANKIAKAIRTAAAALASPAPKGEPCAHDGYSFDKHGRCCPHCSAFLTDFGD